MTGQFLLRHHPQTDATEQATLRKSTDVDAILNSYFRN